MLPWRNKTTQINQKHSKKIVEHLVVLTLGSLGKIKNGKFQQLKNSHQTYGRADVAQSVERRLGKIKIAKICTSKNTQKFNKNCLC